MSDRLLGARKPRAARLPGRARASGARVGRGRSLPRSHREGYEDAYAYFAVAPIMTIAAAALGIAHVVDLGPGAVKFRGRHARTAGRAAGERENAPIHPGTGFHLLYQLATSAATDDPTPPAIHDHSTMPTR